MATCLITEFAGMHRYNKDGGAPVCGPPITTQSVTYTTSTLSSAVNAKTNIIRVIADADVYIAIGYSTSPETLAATATAIKIPSGTVEYFGVRPGQFVACYDGSS